MMETRDCSSAKVSDHSPECKDESADEEPLSKTAQKLKSKSKTSASGEEASSSTPRRSGQMKKESSDKDGSSDDEPLTSVFNKKVEKKPARKNQRNKQVNECEGEPDSPGRDSQPTSLEERKNNSTSELQDESPQASKENDEGSDNEAPAAASQTRKALNKKTSADNKITTTRATRRTNKVHKESPDEGYTSSDDEPLALAKGRKTNGPKVQRKSPRDNKRKNHSIDKCEDGSSDEEPLSKTAKKLKSKRKASRSEEETRSNTPRRSATSKKVKYVDSSSENWDDEPLVCVKRNRTKKTSENSNTQTKDSSSDDDVPLKDVVGRKRQPSKKPATKRSNKPRGSAAKTGQECEDGSSDEEPLSKTAKKLKSKRKASRSEEETRSNTPRRSATSKKVKYVDSSSENWDDEPTKESPDEDARPDAEPPSAQTKEKAKKTPTKKSQSRKDSSSDDDVPLKDVLANKRLPLKKAKRGDSSDDEPLLRASRHPQVTKILRVLLQRYDVAATDKQEIKQ